MPAGQCVIAMPEKCNHEHDDGENVRCLEELVSEVSSLVYQLRFSSEHAIRTG